jgi:hypothetical protein
VTFTYDSSDLSTSLAQIRRAIGDVDISNELLSDEEISHAEDLEGSTTAAAARCCEFVAAEYSRKADMQTGKLKISYSQKSAQYLKMADRLRHSDDILALPYCGAISKDDKETREEDTDRVEPFFRRGMYGGRTAVSLTDSDLDNEETD